MQDLYSDTIPIRYQNPAKIEEVLTEDGHRTGVMERKFCKVYDARMCPGFPFGSFNQMPFGTVPQYDMALHTVNDRLNIEEHAKVWVNAEPCERNDYEASTILRYPGILVVTLKKVVR